MQRSGSFFFSEADVRCGGCDSGHRNIVRPNTKGISADEDVEVEGGSRNTKKMNDPKQPSKE